MTEHRTGWHEEWRAARLDLLQAEKELARLGDDLARRRRDLPWVRLDKDYCFDTEGGEATIADLFQGRSQLLIYHLMFDPEWDEACPSCSAIADGFDKTHLHLQNHDVAFTAVSRAPLKKLLAYRHRMDWGFPWVSSGRTDFNYDFHVTIDAAVAPVEYNYREPGRARSSRQQLARMVRRAARHERLRARGQRRVPHLLRVLARPGRSLEHVAVAGSGAARAK